MTSLSVGSSNSGSAVLFLLLVGSMGDWPDVGILASPGHRSISRFRTSGSLSSSAIPLNALKSCLMNLAVLLNSCMVSCMVSAVGKLFVRSADGWFPERVVLGWSLCPMIWCSPI